MLYFVQFIYFVKMWPNLGKGKKILAGPVSFDEKVVGAEGGLNPFIGFTYKGVRMKTAHGRILGLAASPLSLNTAIEPSKIKKKYPVA